METKQNFLIGKAIHLALGLGIATTFLAASAYAQDVGQQTEEEVAELEKVQVTGTRLTQLQVEGASPVTVISREDLNRVPFDSVGQLLQALPSISGSPVNTFTNNGGNGSTQVDLRGLGAARTLVLVNGRRADASGDLNTLPIAMIERVEVLKEGASAIYGADAVSGVINIITRSDFEGMEVSIQHNDWEVTSAPTTKVSAVTGGSSDRGNFVLGFDFVDQDAAFQADVDDVPWMLQALAIVDPESFRRNGVIVEGPNANVIPLGSSSNEGGRFFLADGRDLTLNYTVNPDGTRNYEDGVQESDFHDYANSDSYNYNPVNLLQTPSKRISFFTQGSYEVNSAFRPFMEAQFQRRESTTNGAPLPYFGDLGDPGFPLSGGLIGTNGASADNYYNPFGQEVSVRRRVVEIGNRDFNRTQDAYRAVVGATGDIGNVWSYEVSYNYSETLIADTDFGQFYGPHLEAALGPSFDAGGGNIVCGDPGVDGIPGNDDDNVIAGCVPLNLFGGPGSITQEMLDYLSVALNDRIDTRTDVVNATLAGDLFELPAGWMQGAFGVERRREKLVSVPDSSKHFDVVSGNTGAGTSGSKEIDSYFFEVGLPVLSDLPMAEVLDLNIGFRRDKFDTFGSANSHSLKLRWQPIDSVLVRATVGTSFREPTISDLYAGQADNFPAVSDPCGRTSINGLTEEQIARCVAQGVPYSDDGNPANDGWNDAGVIQLRSRTGGNLNVQPEEGESFTFGIGWAPEMISGFSVVVDYWDFEITESIGSTAEQTILNKCYLEGVESFCDNVVRNSVTGRPDEILALQDNLGALTAKGLDLELNYAHQTGFGDFDHRLLVTRLLERRQQELPGEPFNELEGQFDNTFVGDSAFPKNRMNYTLDWTLSQWGASARIEYTGKLIDQNEDANLGLWGYGEHQFEIDPVMYLDLTGRYYVQAGPTLEFGITNVTDEEPPYIPGAFNSNIDESIYRPMGLGYFLRVTHHFD